MSSHLLLLVLFALPVSAVFAALAREEPREQLRTGALMFGGFVGSRRRARLADVSVSALTFTVLWGPVLTVMGLIFYASSLSDPGAPGNVSDKAAHFLVYGALGGTLLRALAGGRSARMTARRIFASTVLATLYGVSDEIHQMFVPPRTPDWRDVCADAFGALAGAALVAAGRETAVSHQVARSDRPRT